MGAFIDLTGKKFNRLTVLEKLNKRGNEWYWKCKCDCGNICEVAGVSLRSNRTKSCGCLKKESDRKPKGNVKDEIGNKYSHLTVIKRDGSNKRGQAKWLCQCDCGNPNLISVLGDNLRRGHTTSCGCDRRSKGEKKIIELLYQNNISFIAEKTMFKYNNGSRATFDFYVEDKYLIEYDGETHYQKNLHGWHNEEQLLKQQERDMIKNEWCRTNKIPLIRIPYWHYDDLCIEDLKLETSKYIVEGTY